MKRLYAIGDIHGCYEELEKMYQLIKNDAKGEKSIIACIGDYIDRGPDSKKVIQFLIDHSKNDDQFEWHFIRGNHEDMFLYDKMGMMNNGGIETLTSYANLGETYWDAIVPETHINFIKNTKLYLTFGKVFLSHASVNYDETIEDQTENVLLWTRRFENLKFHEFEYTIHGHTPLKNYIVMNHAIFIDTGCVFGGKLTCVVIPDYDNPPRNEDLQFLQVDGQNYNRIG